MARNDRRLHPRHRGPTAGGLQRGLGLAAGGGWVRPRPEGVAFSELPLRQADELTRRLEDLAASHEECRPDSAPAQQAPTCEQLTLFDASVSERSS